MNVGLRHAWSLWASGDLESNDQLWGLPIFWWGRIGRITEFVAGLAIIAEIIGTERLRAFGYRLREQSLRALSGKTFSDVFGWMNAWWRYLVARSDSPAEREALDATERYAITDTVMVPAMVLWAVVWLVFAGFSFADGNVSRGLLFVLAGALAAFFAPLLVGVLICLAALIGLVVDVFVRSAAWILDREGLDTWIKAGSAFLLALGFHFDLLAP
jgi:di/tricarboxylate transporter